MRNRIILIVIFFSFITIKSNAQYYTLTDTAFRDTLILNGLGTCITGMQLDTTCTALSTITSLSCTYNSNIRNINGIKYLYNLQDLNCQYLVFIDSFPEFPSNLRSLDISEGMLDTLPALPPNLLRLSALFNVLVYIPSLPNSLKFLDVSENQFYGQTLNIPPNLDTLICQNCHIDTLGTLPASIKYINVSQNYNSLSSLPSLPSSLKYLDASNNGLVALPALSTSLEYIDVSRNQLTSLPVLPPSVLYLSCGSNPIPTLPSFPNTLESLSIYGTPLTSPIPALPPSLKYLNAGSCGLTSLPSLGNNIQSIYVNNNQLTSLPSLSSSLNTLYAENNLLTTLPTLPSSLRTLKVKNNQLTALHSMPDTMVSLDFSDNNVNSIDSFPKTCTYIIGDHNYLTSIPDFPTASLSNFFSIDLSSNQITALPDINKSTSLIADSNQIVSISSIKDSILDLDISHNPISCLPPLKPISNSLKIANTNIHCLPNRVTILVGNSDVILDTIPLCQPSSGCPTYWNIAGTVILDANNNCVNDIGELKLKDIPVTLDSGGTILQKCYTNEFGEYSFRSPLGSYDVLIDTTGLPFLTNCPSGITRSINLTSSDSLVDSVDFQFTCRNHPDLAAFSVSPIGAFSPGNFTTIYINVGSASSNYGVACLNDSGTITAVISGPVNYISPNTGALTPAVSGDTLIWTVQDLNSVDPLTSFNFRVITDTTAQINDTVCIQLFVNSINDSNNLNDSLSDCFLVRTSYDPNEKWVSPLEADTTTHTFTYTVLFQNTGNAPAENIYILDTLENDLDASTFQYISSSHNVVTQLLPDNILRFNFHAINLPDSTNNEPESHGFVKFSVRRKPSTGLGTEISNTAYIFFDYNSPIVTNTASLTINGHVSNWNAIKVNDDQISIYPNPAKSYFRFNKKSNKPVDRILIYSMDGQEILKFNSPNTDLISTEKIPTGIYTVLFNIDNNIYYKKLIILK